MITEYEVKILNVDIDLVKKRLSELNAEFIKNRFMKRHVYDLIPPKNNSWLRLRNDSDKITLTLKEIKDGSIEGTQELELEVKDFDLTHELLHKLGFISKSYQENRRITYKLKGAYIEIDSWPKIPPYIEVEGKNKEMVESIVKHLGFKMSDTTSISTQKVYKKYGIDISKLDKVTFG